MPIHIEHLYKVLGKQEVLHDICLDIADGEVVGLLGPNGAGKSTLMKILLGLWRPTSGIINAPTTHGYLPELNPLYENMYVREYLLFMWKVESGKWKVKVESESESVESMMEKVGLMPVANKRIGELSKGYRQRVGIAQAMLGHPELLILDEPTTGLDPNQVVEVRKLIGASASSVEAEGRKGGRAERRRCITILSTHRLEDVAEVCTRVIILDRGIVKYDSAEGRKGGEAERQRGAAASSLEAEGQRIKDKGQRIEEIFRQVTNYGK